MSRLQNCLCGSEESLRQENFGIRTLRSCYKIMVLGACVEFAPVPSPTLSARPMDAGILLVGSSENLALERVDEKRKPT